MSIQNEISRLSGNVSDALDAISSKGVTVPAGANSDDLATLISAIDNSIDIDSQMSDTSQNPVQNNTIKAYVDTGLSGKQDTLVSGTSIKTIGNTSLLGSGDIDIFLKKSGGTLTGSLILGGNTFIKNGNQYSFLQFKTNVSTNNGNDNFGPASIFVDSGSTTAETKNQFYFRTYSPTSSDANNTTYTSYYDTYSLPAVGIGKTANNTYSILTSKSAVTVAQGGTGATTFTSGNALIGAGTDAITTRAITNMTSKAHITYNTNLMTTNTLAYWNGAYSSGNASNLTYYTGGTIYGSGQFGWKRIAMNTTSTGSATVTATGVTATSVISAQRVGSYSDNSGSYGAIGASSSNAGNIRVHTAAGSNGGNWTVHLFWTKTATGG